jgi:hypothetical protein
MRKPFVVISGLPGSGKTTLGRRLAPILNLPLIDKDDILNRLFESKGVGSSMLLRITWSTSIAAVSSKWQRAASVKGGAIAGTSMANRLPQKSWRVFESSLNSRRSTLARGSMSTRPKNRTCQMSFARFTAHWDFSRDQACSLQSTASRSDRPGIAVNPL